MGRVLPMFEEPTELAERRRLRRDAREKGVGFPWVQLSAQNGYKEFARIYPERGPHEPAQRAWARLSSEDQIECLRRLPAIVEAWYRGGYLTKENIRYIRHRASFINDRAWRAKTDDEAAAESAAKAEAMFGALRPSLGCCHHNKNGHEPGPQCDRDAVWTRPETGNVYCETHAVRWGYRPAMGKRSA